MVQVRFLNGLREIGGTFVEVETDKAKCMFDFGFSRANVLDETLSFREDLAASDLASLGILAITDGIYDELNATRLSVKPYKDPSYPKECFLIISHLHIDHIGGLGFLHDELPVYMTEDALTLYRVMERHHDVQGRAHKNCIGVAPSVPFTVGDITVTPLSIDHDCTGACGFLIAAKGKTVCYTGDYRFHGYHPEVSKAFAATAASHHVDLLITEGVTVSHEDVDMLSLTAPEENKRTEYDLLEELKQRASADGLLIVNPYPRNVERLHRMYETFRAAGRTLLFDAMCCDYCKAFYPDDALSVYEDTLHGRDVPFGVQCVTKEQLLSDPSRFVLQLAYEDIYCLADLREVTAAYLHIDGSPLGDYMPSYGKLLAMLSSWGIPHERRSISGHAEPYYLRYMIDTIAPRILVPLHSFRPEQVQSDKAKERILPVPGQVLTL